METINSKKNKLHSDNFYVRSERRTADSLIHVRKNGSEHEKKLKNSVWNKKNLRLRSRETREWENESRFESECNWINGLGLRHLIIIIINSDALFVFARTQVLSLSLFSFFQS